MATATPRDRANCFTCDKEKIVYPCEGCSRKFCLKDLTEHRQSLSKQFEGIENDRDQFYQKLAEQKKDPKKHSLIQQVDKWEKASIRKIKQTAEECRQILIDHENKHLFEIEKKLSELTTQLKESRQEDEFNEIDLDRFKTTFIKLAEELGQPPNIRIQQDLTSFISKISIVVSSRICQENEFNEINLDRAQTNLSEDLNQWSNVSMPRDLTSFTSKNSTTISSGKCDNDI
ncbi:unnamed protein product [Rotaria sp. Silwood2]|nr:unnamed protein product [Rotaria sp. Silwood2]CAF4244580.1 unnamed protein product [Rotaria sp. Silwood2]